MKVLHFISDRNVGGAGIYLCNLLKRMPKSEISATVALPENSLLQPRLQEIGVKTCFLQRRCEKFGIFSIAEAVRICRKERPDVVHTHGAVCGRIAGRLCNVPVVHTRHCYYPLKKNGFRRFLTPVCKIFNSSFSDFAIATAIPAADNLVTLGFPKERIAVILNGSLPVRELSESEKNAFRERYCIPSDAVCVGMAARLEPCKGHSVFLSAISELQRELPPALAARMRYLLAGEGSLCNSLQKCIRELGLVNTVLLLGFQKDMAPFYRNLTVQVNCSVGTETSCLALSEGMSSGLPTVASDYGGNPRMLKDDAGCDTSDHNGNTVCKCGILYPAGNSHALCHALSAILTDDALQRSMSDAARERYQTLFRAERMAKQTQAVYQKAIQRHKNKNVLNENNLDVK